MKKILLATAAASLLSSSVAFAEPNTFYGRVFGGAGIFAKTKVGAKRIGSFKTKSTTAGFAGIALGYNIMENVRADISFDHYFGADLKTKDRTTKNPSSNTTAVTESAKVKTGINTILVNGFVDVYNAGPVTFFAGAGVGMSMIDGKASYSAKATYSDGSTKTHSSSLKAKKKNNFAYAVYAGISTELTSGVYADLSYSFRGMGKVNKKTKNKNLSFSSTPDLRTHNIVAAIRFNF